MIDFTVHDVQLSFDDPRARQIAYSLAWGLDNEGSDSPEDARAYIEYIRQMRINHVFGRILWGFTHLEEFSN